VCVNSTNRLHATHALAALRAGKHVIVEKPMCLTLAEADAILEAARAAGRGLGYAENLCFAPRYREARRLVDTGAVGRVLYARQREKHGGPYSDWFWSAEEAGGGALLDMGCHGIECLRWLVGKPHVARVSAEIRTLLHGARTDLDDDAIVWLELEDGTRLVSESSWAVKSGMESDLEVHGTEGTLYVDLMGETGLRLHREPEGWTRPMADPLGSLGYPQQLEHFLDCFASGAEPEEGGRDGRAVLEIALAAYASARSGRPVALPLDPPGVERPVDLWRDR
jgi:predicted dehydrogenase